MKAYTLVRHSTANNAFELRESPDPVPAAGEVTITVDAFGLNFADIIMRRGKYKGAPDLPYVPGYEVVGRITAVGEGVTDFEIGQRVTAFTRFGGYATHVAVDTMGVVPISEDMPTGVALALTVQYCTAWYCAEESVSMHPGDHVLVQAAAGGVGTALVQMAKRRGCIVYGTASPQKLDHIKALGVDHPINYRVDDFAKVIKEMRGDKGVDIIFDCLGGSDFRRSLKLLSIGGRIVGFGNASNSDDISGFFGDLKTFLNFGFSSPAFLLLESQAIIGVNMLKIADERPHILNHCMKEVVKCWEKGEFKPVVGKTFTSDQLVEAQEFLEGRKSIGKIVVEWV